MLATSYPLLDLFLTMLWFALIFFWILLAFHIIFDIFRSHDMGGFAKALWLIFIVILPFLGVFIYVVARGGGMQQRQMAAAVAQQKQFEDYVRSVAATPPSTPAS